MSEYTNLYYNYDIDASHYLELFDKYNIDIDVPEYLLPPEEIIDISVNYDPEPIHRGPLMRTAYTALATCIGSFLIYQGAATESEGGTLPSTVQAIVNTAEQLPIQYASLSAASGVVTYVAKINGEGLKFNRGSPVFRGEHEQDTIINGLTKWFGAAAAGSGIYALTGHYGKPGEILGFGGVIIAAATELAMNRMARKHRSQHPTS